MEDPMDGISLPSDLYFVDDGDGRSDQMEIIGNLWWQVIRGIQSIGIRGWKTISMLVEEHYY